MRAVLRPLRRYQFQSFAQYRGKLAQKTAEELDTLRTHEDVWSVLGVLNYLQALVDTSGIVAELSAPGAHAGASALTLALTLTFTPKLTLALTLTMCINPANVDSSTLGRVEYHIYGCSVGA